MEINKMKRKGIFCCACAVISCWFIFILFMTLTKVDDEYTKGLLKIDKAFSKWRLKRKEVKERDHFWYKENKDDLTNLLPPNQRGRLIRNWLSSDEKNLEHDNLPLNKTGDQRFDAAKSFLIRKMREKIISIYGDVLTVPVNDSSFVKVRNWKKKEENDVISKISQENYSYDFVPVSQEVILVKSKSFQNVGKTNLTTARPSIWSPKTLVAPFKSSKRFKKMKGILNATRTKNVSITMIKTLVPKTTLSRKENNDQLKDITEDLSIRENESIEAYLNRLKPDKTLDPESFVLSNNETRYLRKLFYAKDDFLDRKETNAHNELGPVNIYIDKVLDEDRRNYAKKPRKKKRKKIKERKFERKQISIVVGHNRNLRKNKREIRKVIKETPPPEARIGKNN